MPRAAKFLTELNKWSLDSKTGGISTYVVPFDIAD